MTAPFRVVVLGAGVEALACACELAAHGSRGQGGVSVAIAQSTDERAAKQGIKAQGFSFDAGETMITRPELLDSLFARAGRTMADYLGMIEIDPFTSFWFDDGVVVHFRRDIGRFARQIDQQFPHDRQGANFCNLVLALRAGEHAKIPELERVLTEWHVSAVYRHTYRTWETRAVDNGMWYTFGGVRQVGFALERLAAELGVEFVCVSREKRDELGQAGHKGIRNGQTCVDDDVLQTDAVIDCRGETAARTVLLWGINRRYQHLAHHNVFGGNGWDIRVHAPCGIDPAHAPVGGDALTIDVQLSEPDVARTRAIEFLKPFGMGDIEKRIVFERTAVCRGGIDAGQAANCGIEKARKLMQSRISAPVYARDGGLLT